MKKTIIALVGSLLLSASWAGATVTMSFNDYNGAASAATVAAGSSFSFDVYLAITNTGSGDQVVPDMRGYSFWFITDSGSSGKLTLTSRSFTDTIAGSTTFNQTSPFADSSQSPAGDVLSTTANTNDIGATDNAGAQVTNATYFLQTLTLTAANNLAAGTYTIFTTTHANDPKFSEVNDSAFATHQIPTASYTITVVPEPATWSLMGLGGLGSLGLTWLRARRRS